MQHNAVARSLARSPRAAARVRGAAGAAARRPRRVCCEASVPGSALTVHFQALVSIGPSLLFLIKIKKMGPCLEGVLIARSRSMEAYFQQIGTLQMSEKEEEAQQKAKKEAHNLNSVIVAVSEPQLSEKTGPEPKEADADQVGTVPFAESAWTFPVLLGLTSASSLDVAFAVLLLLLNLGMQVSMGAPLMTLT